MTEIKKTKSTTTKKPVATGQTVQKNDYESSKIEQLEAQVAALMKLVGQQLPSQEKSSTIDLDTDIDVISLCNTQLNLSTGGYGHGELYQFSEFGQVKPIPLRDLRDIVRNNESFVKAGYFYIDNSDARVAMRISKTYESMPDKEMILNLFKKDSKTFVKVFEMMPAGQKEMFASMIVDKIYKEESIDMNIVAKCGKIVGRDLANEARIRKELRDGGE